MSKNQRFYSETINQNLMNINFTFELPFHVETLVSIYENFGGLLEDLEDM